MKITDIAKPFGLSGVAFGKKMDLAKLRENGKPTQLAIDSLSARLSATAPPERGRCLSND